VGLLGLAPQRGFLEWSRSCELCGGILSVITMFRQLRKTPAALNMNSFRANKKGCGFLSRTLSSSDLFLRQRNRLTREQVHALSSRRSGDVCSPGDFGIGVAEQIDCVSAVVEGGVLLVDRSMLELLIATSPP